MDARTTLARLGIRPKKSLGQHFMVDPAALERVAAAADLVPDDAVLEIGAGLGALTEILASRAGRVVAVELDQRLIAALGARFEPETGIKIVHGDILELDPAGLMGADAGRYKAVGNVPYYITSAIVRHLLESSAPPALLVLTVQHEVAERMAARPGDMSLLAVSVQVYGRVSVVERLKPGAFWPRPDVESAVVRIEPHAEPPVTLAPEERADSFRVVRAGFSQKRKQLRNSLAAGLRLDADQVAERMQVVGIDPSRRAETLSLQEWGALYRVLADGG
jgi:16S rRNA (adenine1518-N6/adenine1519-N6)-dimethyltransferase